MHRRIRLTSIWSVLPIGVSVNTSGALATFVVGTVIVLAGCSSGQSPTAEAQNPTVAAQESTPPPEVSFSAKFDQSPMQMGGPDSHGVVTYIVQFDVTNTSKVAGTPVCVLLNSVQLTAVPRGNIIRTIDREAPGQTRTVSSGVAISGRGAEHATDWSIHCQQGTELPLNQ
jgi:hypothetical protein